MSVNRTRLAAAVDILQWLECDAQTAERIRVARDREIGRGLAPMAGQPAYRLVLAWWAEISAGSHSNPGATPKGHRLATLTRLATGVLVLLGLCVGIGVAGVAFGYQGDYPVNLFALLGVVVGLPLILLILSLLLIRGRTWLASSLGDALAVLSPGRWAGGWLERHLPVGLFESVSGRPTRGDFARWQLLAFSQSFAIAYFAGVLLVAWALIIFTDLAFGWSTTLDIDSSYVARWMQAMAWPWAGWLPVAVPDESLVNASRFFRLEANAISGARAAELGRWWPFVLMTIAVYGLVPRLLLAWFANWQVARSTRRLLEEGPEITALLDRLSTPAVTFEGMAAEDAPESTGELPGEARLEIDAGSAVVLWNESMTRAQVSTWLSTRAPAAVQPIEAAEWQSAEEQRARLRALGRSTERMLILTKGWEPPLLAFNDYLRLVREELGEELRIVIVPLDTSASGVKSADRDIWAHALARRADPRLYVVGAT